MRMHSVVLREQIDKVRQGDKCLFSLHMQSHKVEHILISHLHGICIDRKMLMLYMPLETFKKSLERFRLARCFELCHLL